MLLKKVRRIPWWEYLRHLSANSERLLKTASFARLHLRRQASFFAVLLFAFLVCGVEQVVESRLVAGMYEKSLQAATADVREIATFLEHSHVRVLQSIRWMQEDLGVGRGEFVRKQASRMELLGGLHARVEVVRRLKSPAQGDLWQRETGEQLPDEYFQGQKTFVNVPGWDMKGAGWSVTYFNPGNAGAHAVLVTIDISDWLSALNARGSAYEEGGLSIFSADGVCYGTSNPRLGTVGGRNTDNPPFIPRGDDDAQGVQEAKRLVGGELPHSHVYKWVPGTNVFVVADLLAPGLGAVEQQIWAVRVIFVLAGLAVLLLLWWQFQNTLEIRVIHKVAQAAQTEYQAQITEKSLQIEKTNKELRLMAVPFHSKLGVLIADKEARIVRVNAAFQEMSGYAEVELIGKNPNIFSSGEHDREFFADMWRAILENNFWTGVILDRRKDGSLITKETTITAVRGADGAIEHYVSISEDLTEIKKKESEIERLAFFDPLTNLPNRRLFLDRLTVAIGSSKRRNTVSALVYIDLDNFKLINDSLGHVAGDELLFTVATRLQAIMRAQDTVCRFGGDEFVVLLQDVGDSAPAALSNATAKADEIRDALARPYVLGGANYVCTASIGVSLVDVEEPPSASIGHADLAMYEAKRRGKNHVEAFEKSMEERLQSRIAIERKLRQAIDHQQFCLYLQPQVDAAGHLVSAEALIRWLEPDGTLVSPAEFIPIAEETGLILDIGTWVLQEACRILGALVGTAGVPPDFRLSVNISALQFAMPDFVDLVRDTVARYAVPAHCLVLELTESIAVSGVADVARKMRLLREEVGVICRWTILARATRPCRTCRSCLLTRSRLTVHLSRRSSTTPRSRGC